MGCAPAVIIVARHGARLDAADTQWHLTSPTPYDPPLTYGGWRQSQALGAKIADVIQSREAGTSSQNTNGLKHGTDINGGSEGEVKHFFSHSRRGRRRRQKVIIHSSPFLRCIQTSIAISAGMAQHQGVAKANVHQFHGKHTLHSAGPHVRSMDQGRPSQLSAIPEPDTGHNSSSSDDTETGLESRSRPILRVDAFLGEWLSPEYFDKITPPPQSKLMVASAKAELLRRGDPVTAAQASIRDTTSQGKGNFPGGWGSTNSVTVEAPVVDEQTPLADMASLNQTLPKLARAKTHGMAIPTKRSSNKIGLTGESGQSSQFSPYVPPIPSYAVSPSQPIPQGYVAHARDACTKVDYQWDSLRPPLEWGDGGHYGEEWSSMHKRFRRGLHQMISRYKSHDPNALVRSVSEGLPDKQAFDDIDDEDTDTVLILVTHGAGCNALIGALTNQPVLIDVGTASLTLAMRKTIDYRRVPSPTVPRPQSSPSCRRLSSYDFGISDDYEVKLIASTDHLRAGSKFLPASRLQRTTTVPTREKSPYRYERPHFVDSHHRRSPVLSEDAEAYSGSNSSAPTTKNQYFESADGLTANSPPLGGGGLWSKPIPVINNHINENGTEKTRKPVSIPVPQLDGISEISEKSAYDQSDGSVTNGKDAESKRTNGISEKYIDGHAITPSGLWGAPPSALATERDVGAKRRWTLSQAS